MKTIVIRPEIIAYHNSAFRDPKPPVNWRLVACVALLPAVALVGWLAGRSTGAPARGFPGTAAAVAQASVAAQPAPKIATVAADGSIELQSAIEQGLINADFTANGRDRLDAELSNPTAKPVTVRVSFGQMFESGRNSVVAARTAQTEIAPGKSAALAVQTVATRSTNRVGRSSYRLSTKIAPKLDLLLAYAQDHPDFSVAALQTAALALTENLTLSSVCKFTTAGSELPSRFDTTAFRAGTLDLLAALGALREIGVRDRDLAMTVDPQLKIEAMIDPVSRAAAMRYYGITSATEWNYWKSQLLEGEPGLRHYALYGIARFYPEIALDMLPKWAREKRTTQIFRLTAVQALAETQRGEALPVLSDLVAELGRNTELGRAALNAAQLLDATLRKAAESARTVAFRGAVAQGAF
ncbi:MAG TPA: hypothetical protein VEO95_13670 [Chthoniobacteraceae bacterium]|nr:hypothetical protein [Chthoniobacteraceae bacterium]